MKRFLAFIVMISLAFPSHSVFAEREGAGKHGAALSKAEKEAVLSILYDADISLVRQVVSTGVITCAELTEYYLERISEYDSEYNCFITICDDAVEKAALRDEQLAAGKGEGALFGVPVVIKDNMDLAGYPTTNGRDPADSQVADSNADVVDKLLNAGAVIVGKTNMSTDAQDIRASYSEAVGETKNAYDTELASGGSSGGSAVAVSLDFACAGLGTDTDASLRIPSALNGCISLRSAAGLIPMSGIVPLDTGRDVVGAITRNVYDQAVMLDVLTESAYDFTEKLNDEALENARIGILAELTEPQEDSDVRTAENLDDEVTGAFENAVKELKSCKAEVVDISMPDIFFPDESDEDEEPPADEAQMYETFETLLQEEELDAVIFPSYLSAPLKSGVDEEGRFWDVDEQVFIDNCSVLSPSAGLPEISVPIGRHSSGAGIGMEIATLKGGEQLLLDLAYSYTKKYDHREVPEGAPDIYGGKAQMSVEELIGRNAMTVSAAGIVAKSGTTPEGSMERWMHTGNVLLICGVSAALVIMVSYRLIMRGKRREKKKRKPKERNRRQR